MKKENNNTDEEIKKEIGNNIRNLRRKMRNYLTVDKVAAKLGVTRGALTQIENGRNNVNAVTLWKLSCVLGCDIKEFFPSIPEGYELSKNDMRKIEKEGSKKATKWARELFGEPKN
ncbi:MAG: helix-turn-helix transcriptional regulator [bacterium]|nr:helix-turn-helix transcriptional regulator [bacterium]